MLGATTGLAAVLTLLLAAVQVLAGLHATTVTSTAALTAARTVASAGVDHSDPSALAAARHEGERQARQLLGRSGQEASFHWPAPENHQVRVSLSVPGPTLLGAGPFSAIERSAAVSLESLR